MVIKHTYELQFNTDMQSVMRSSGELTHLSLQTYAMSLHWEHFNFSLLVILKCHINCCQSESSCYAIECGGSSLYILDIEPVCET